VARGLHAAVALPHGEQFTAEPHVLFDDVELFDGTGVLRAILGLNELLGEQLNISPNNGERITQIVNELG
jgi:hypothetical protein